MILNDFFGRNLDEITPLGFPSPSDHGGFYPSIPAPSATGVSSANLGQKGIG